MIYRRLGRSGLKVSVLSFGSWVSFDNQMKDDLAMECMQTAFDAGCNFFDNAEAYAGGRERSDHGSGHRRARLASLELRARARSSSGASSSVPNMRNTLNRKYLMQAIDGSLERLGVDFLDLIFCHRADPETPIEETVWAMSDIVSSGKALYWGTSEWTADEIRAAWEIAERHHLHKPVMEQPQYNLLDRKQGREGVRQAVHRHRSRHDDLEPARVGLADGQVQGRYSRRFTWRARRLRVARRRGCRTTRTLAKVERLRPIADELGCTWPRCRLAWCAANPNVSTVITGASRPSQVAENFAAIDVLPLLTPEVMASASTTAVA